MRRRIVAGNWKLHGDRAFAHALLDEIAASPARAGVDLVVLPPLPYLGELAEDYPSIAFGAQDVSANAQGAYTGEVCASMLVDVGARYGLVGHSERRQYHHEDERPGGAEVPGRPQCGPGSDPLRRREPAPARVRPDRILHRAAVAAGIRAVRGPGLRQVRSSPMNRSGRSGPARPLRPNRRRPSTHSSVAKSPRAMLKLRARCRSSMAAAANPATPRRCSHSPTSMAG